MQMPTGMLISSGAKVQNRDRCTAAARDLACQLKHVASAPAKGEWLHTWAIKSDTPHAVAACWLGLICHAVSMVPCHLSAGCCQTVAV